MPGGTQPAKPAKPAAAPVVKFKMYENARLIPFEKVTQTLQRIAVRSLR